MIIRTAALICEFNPFHNGHKYIIEQIKAHHADRLICIMSGNFVQRGDISITDKFSKCKTALENGADAVIELPCTYANSNAQRFAENGTVIADALNCDLLCFGVQDCTTDDLSKIITELELESSRSLIKKSLMNGNSFPKALSDSISENSSELSGVLKDSNNILAMEYMKASSIYNITPIGIPRIKVSHDSSVPKDNIASASYIRKLIYDRDESYTAYTDTRIDNPAFLKNINDMILYRLKCMTLEDIASLPEITEGIENRIYSAVSENNSIDDIINCIKTKRYTMSKIKRILISALLGITDELQKLHCPYIRVLGLKNGYDPKLSLSKLPLVCNVKKDRAMMSAIGRKTLDIDILSSRLYALAKDIRKDNINDYTNGIIRI